MISSFLGPRRWPFHGHASHEPRKNAVFMPPPEPWQTKTPCSWFWRFPWLPSTSMLARHAVFQGTLTYLKVPFSFLLVFIWFFLGRSCWRDIPNLTQSSSRKDGEYSPVPWSQCHSLKTFKLWGSFVILEGLFYKDISDQGSWIIGDFLTNDYMISREQYILIIK